MPSAPLPEYRSSTRASLTSLKIENSASLTRAPVGRVASPGGAFKARPRSRPATTRTRSAPEQGASRGFDLAPHLSAHALAPSVFGGNDARHAAGGDELALLSQARQHRLADQVGARDRAAHRFTAELQIASGLAGPQAIHGLGAGGRAVQVGALYLAPGAGTKVP